MKIRNIKVTFKRDKEINPQVETMTDWYDFADWLKQETLGKHTITIIGWEYDRGVLVRD